MHKDRSQCFGVPVLHAPNHDQIQDENCSCVALLPQIVGEHLQWKTHPVCGTADVYGNMFLVVPRHKFLFAIPPPANLCFLYHVLLPTRNFCNMKRPTGNSSCHSLAFQKNLTAFQGGLMDWDPKGILPWSWCRCSSKQIKWMVIIPWCFQVQFLDHGHVTPHRVLHPEAGATVLRSNCPMIHLWGRNSHAKVPTSSITSSNVLQKILNVIQHF